MFTHPVATLLASITAGLYRRVERLRAQPDRGSHAVEYGIGIGLAAAVILGLFAAYKTGVAGIIAGWVFQ